MLNKINILIFINILCVYTYQTNNQRNELTQKFYNVLGNNFDLINEFKVIENKKSKINETMFINVKLIDTTQNFSNFCLTEFQNYVNNQCEITSNNSYLYVYFSFEN